MQKFFHRFTRHLQSSFQLFVIMVMASCGVIGITPFAIYRFWQGSYLLALAELVTVVALIWAGSHAWRTLDTVKPSLALSIIFSITAVIASLKLGVIGFFWVFPLILFNFFAIAPRHAVLVMLAICLVLCGFQVLAPEPFVSDEQLLSFLVACLVASMLTYVFAQRLFEQQDHLQQLAVLDPLTGALNRRAMDEHLENACEDRRNPGYGLLLLDLDFFKTVNDEFGHSAGDQALADLVRLVQGILRQHDRLYRFGGEEFAVLIPGADQPVLQLVAEKIRNHIFANLRVGDRYLSVSVGGALLCRRESWQQWLERADQALYQVKSAGRNGVLIAPEC